VLNHWTNLSQGKGTKQELLQGASDWVVAQEFSNLPSNEI
jgi:hypothetical protein